MALKRCCFRYGKLLEICSWLNAWLKLTDSLPEEQRRFLWRSRRPNSRRLLTVTRAKSQIQHFSLNCRNNRFGCHLFIEINYGRVSTTFKDRENAWKTFFIFVFEIWHRRTVLLLWILSSAFDSSLEVGGFTKKNVWFMWYICYIGCYTRCFFCQAKCRSFTTTNCELFFFYRFNLFICSVLFLSRDRRTGVVSPLITKTTSSWKMESLFATFRGRCTISVCQDNTGKTGWLRWGQLD